MSGWRSCWELAWLIVVVVFNRKITIVVLHDEGQGFVVTDIGWPAIQSGHGPPHCLQRCLFGRQFLLLLLLFPLMLGLLFSLLLLFVLPCLLGLSLEAL